MEELNGLKELNKLPKASSFFPAHDRWIGIGPTVLIPLATVIRSRAFAWAFTPRNGS